MNKEELLAQLRNKLTPVKNYFELQQKLDGYNVVGYAVNYSEETAWKRSRDKKELEDTLYSEKQKCEKLIPEIEQILEQLEKAN